MKKAMILFLLGFFANVSFFGQTTDPINVSPTGVVSINTSNLIVNGVEYSFIPVGAIIMWSGDKVPDGWALCDGSPGTPDLRKKFIAGYDGTGYKIGTTGGADTVILTPAQMPSHTHGMQYAGSHSHTFTGYNDLFDDDEITTSPNSSLNAIANIPFSVSTADNGSHVHTIDSAGSDTAHENRPPFYILAYIMKIATKGTNTALSK